MANATTTPGQDLKVYQLKQSKSWEQVAADMNLSVKTCRLAYDRGEILNRRSPKETVKEDLLPKLTAKIEILARQQPDAIPRCKEVALAFVELAYDNRHDPDSAKAYADCATKISGVMMRFVELQASSRTGPAVIEVDFEELLVRTCDKLERSSDVAP